MEIKNKSIFMTGGGGFIGSHLIERLINDNEITVYDNARRDALQYTRFKEHKNLRFITGDVLDFDLLKKSIPGHSIVIHMAAIAGVSSYYKMPLRTMQVNFNGTANVLQLLLEQKNLDLYLDFSTSEIYGPVATNVSEIDNTTQGRIDDRRWVYSISKLASEKLGYCYFWEHGLPVATVRPFNVYGPRQVGEGVISNFVRNALANEDIQITGDGQQKRAMCYVDDFVDGVLALMRDPAKAAGKSFNIGDPSGEATVLDIAERVIRISGSHSKIKLVPHLGSDIMNRIPNIKRMQETFSYAPKVSLDTGISHCISWSREHA